MRRGERTDPDRASLRLRRASQAPARRQLGPMSDAAYVGAPPLAQALWIAAAAGARLRDGTPLERGLAEAQAQIVAQLRQGERLHPRAAAAAKDVAFTAARHRALTDALITRLASRPPDPPVAALLGVALAQLRVQRHAAYAVVDQTVSAAKEDDATRDAAGFVNAVLRNALRRFDDLVAEAERDEAVRCNLPRWWLERLQRAYPQDWEQIASLQRQPPPLVLRVNALRISRDDYLAQLVAAQVEAVAVGTAGVWLRRPRPVDDIPGFASGLVAVQDAGAQLAAEWLGVADGMRVLDACAAPGGKTAHLASLAAVDLTAVDSDRERVRRIDDNLRRLGRHDRARIKVVVADVALAATGGALPHRQYDRILLDAPCTASGIVRRHPDIPWLRRPADVVQLATQQARLLDALWPLLAPAGRLLYTVCSLFPDEGAQQIQDFIGRVRGARPVPLPECDGEPVSAMQLLPVESADNQVTGVPGVHDGFFYALIEKQS